MARTLTLLPTPIYCVLDEVVILGIDSPDEEHLPVMLYGDMLGVVKRDSRANLSPSVDISSRTSSMLRGGSLGNGRALRGGVYTMPCFLGLPPRLHPWRPYVRIGLVQGVG
jgi:hypothetical protein